MAEKKQAAKSEQKEKAAQDTQINPAAGKDIDERMADLLKDHQAMGARPKG